MCGVGLLGMKAFFKEVDWERYGLCACIQPSPDLMVTSFPRNRRDCKQIPITESLISLFSEKLSPDRLSARRWLRTKGTF